jgi:hypothetical protein
MKATVREKNFAAGALRVLLELVDGTELVASRYGIDANVSVGQNVTFHFSPEDAVLVDRPIRTQEPDEQVCQTLSPDAGQKKSGQTSAKAEAAAGEDSHA